jgi:hypothetical protein
MLPEYDEIESNACKNEQTELQVATATPVSQEKKRDLSGTRSVNRDSSCSSSCSMLSTSSTTPQRKPTKADMFFYDELRSTIGQVNAQHWLATQSSTCRSSRTASCKLNNGSRRPDDKLCDRSHECDIASLISWHREKAGMLFTDAAHEHLDSDSPRSEGVIHPAAAKTAPAAIKLL